MDFLRVDPVFWNLHRGPFIYLDVHNLQHIQYLQFLLNLIKENISSSCSRAMFGVLPTHLL